MIRQHYRASFLHKMVLWLTAAVVVSPARVGAQPQPPQTAAQAYKNIKVLMDAPADSINQSMHLISGALGVDCEYCHTPKGRENDTVKNKDVARDMLTMTAELNRRAFKGEPAITCYTCHRGHAIPESVPILPVPDYEKEKVPETGLPSVDQILSRYIQAIGGERNLRKITSRVIRARQDIPTGPGGVNPSPADVEVLQKVPDLMIKVAKTTQITSMNGFDAEGAWSQDDRGRVAPPVALEQIRERYSNDFYEPLDMAKEYSDLKLEGTERIGPKETWVVTGLLAPDAPVRLYFDKRSGLLVRRYTLVPTPAGPSPFQVDYDGYRDAGNGVKYAYRMHFEPAGPRTELATHSTMRITRIQENVPIDNGKFTRPVSKDLPPR